VAPTHAWASEASLAPRQGRLAATAEGGPVLIVVSVHDVAPTTLDDVRWLTARLDALGVRRRVLMAIPAPDGAELDPDSPTAELLRDEQALGNEVVLHGYTHRTVGAFRGSAWDAFRARTFAPRDAEFLSVDAGEARRRLDRGRAVLERAGLAVRGFCPPGWFASPGLDAQLAAAGFTHAIGLIRLADLHRRRHRTVPSFGYMGADAFQERLVGVGGDTSLALHRWAPGPVPHLRAFLHPQGAQTADACLRTLERIEALAAGEPAGTYAELLDGWHD
jgi:predicted deacetylase